MIELRKLRAFLATCQHPSLAQAAADLGMATSTLSSALTSLEQELGTELFRRTRAGLYPVAAALRLYPLAAAVLQTEVFGRRLMRSSKRHDRGLLTIEIAREFSLGNISNALNAATEAIAKAYPLIMVELRWQSGPRLDLIDQLSHELQLPQRGHVVVRVQTDASDSADIRDSLVLTDPWVLGYRLPKGTHRTPRAAQMLAGPVIVPAVQAPLIVHLERHLRVAKIVHVRFASDHPGLLSTLLHDNPEAAALAPASFFSAQVGLARVVTVPLEPPLATTIVARIEQPDPAAQAFVDQFRKALHASRSDRPREPVIASRTIHYFHLLYRTRRVSIAAHTADIAQPAMSDQLHKLEAALRVQLFDRRNDGLVPTVDGEQFAPVATAVERGLQAMIVAATAAHSHAGNRLTLGILPSVSQHGYLVNKVSEAVLAVQARNRQLNVTVTEGPTDTLQRWVTSGLVGIAIVDTGLPDMPRLPLSVPEPLAVIAYPGHALLRNGPVTLATLASLPLALPGRLFGLRETLDAAAQAHGLRIAPQIEIDGLAMLIAVLGRAPLCTVLPPSAVQKELDSGELIAHPIIEPEIYRKLFVIYSADRSLTAPERDLVSTLQAGLASPQMVGRAADGRGARQPASQHTRTRRGRR